MCLPAPRRLFAKPSAEHPSGADDVEVEARLAAWVVLDPRGAGTLGFEARGFGEPERVGVRAPGEAEHDAGRRMDQRGSPVEDHATIQREARRELVPEPSDQVRMGAEGLVGSCYLVRSGERRHARSLVP